MIKFRLYFDKDAETTWLNKMAAQGWAMKKFFLGFYYFEPCQEGEYTYQIDFGEQMFYVSKDYSEFMQDAGVEILQVWGPWVILRKLTAERDFVLYSDVESSIEHYSKIQKMFKVLTIVELLCVMLEVLAGVNGFAPGYFFAFLFGAVVVAFINVAVNTGNIIAELKQRIGQSVKPKRPTRVSAFLMLGFLINSFAMCMREFESLKTGMQIIAIIAMLIGIFRTLIFTKERASD